MDIDTRESSEELVYYYNGALKKRKGRHLHQEFYPDGALLYESRYDRKSGTERSMYYYQNGKIMSIQITKESKKNPANRKSRKKYYDLSGKRVSEKYLIQQGYKSVLGL